MKIDDDKCQVIIGGEEEAVESAVSALEDWKIARNKTHPPDTTATQNPVSATIQLDQTEAWLVSALVGKGGGKIKRLRSEAACKIEVDSAAFIITVSASDEDSLQFGLDVTQKAVEAERSRCAEVQISPEKVSAFIGLKGSHVHDFEQLHDVKVKAYKGKSVLRIFGEPSSVVLARAALEEWVKADESATDGASRI
uniref:K Homology domain-containing protein n=1 Tax=Amphora coffeiformis TaxID=265554 RepID=A0A7S3LGQ7_9STRA